MSGRNDRQTLREWVDADGSVMAWWFYPLWLRRVVCGDRHDRVTLDDVTGTRGAVLAAGGDTEAAQLRVAFAVHLAHQETQVGSRWSTWTASADHLALLQREGYQLSDVELAKLGKATKKRPRAAGGAADPAAIPEEEAEDTETPPLPAAQQDHPAPKFDTSTLLMAPKGERDYPTERQPTPTGWRYKLGRKWFFEGELQAASPASADGEAAPGQGAANDPFEGLDAAFNLSGVAREDVSA